MIEWTDERVAQLRDLWMKGLSATQIAGVMRNGMTRNAVIGKVHRLGLSRQKVPSRAAAKRKAERAAARGAPWDGMSEREKVTYVREATEAGRAASMIAQELGATVWQVSSVRARARLSAPRPVEVEPAEVIALEPTPLRTIMTIREGECRAVIGDPAAEEPAMCGRPTEEGAHLYCAHHKRRFVSVARTEKSNILGAINEFHATRVRAVVCGSASKGGWMR